ncbi:hypothetical protein GGX14DRAFT_391974 [Mycena pura]|uniref:Uncharacterized protein n=1 Tax=Mycena pura TaxID=153505 RepID=A0AAD6VK92_9AGAR|nr:hypothetical protein GGX14DRAFT_391974 [Mycena pura]
MSACVAAWDGAERQQRWALKTSPHTGQWGRRQRQALSPSVQAAAPGVESSMQRTRRRARPRTPERAWGSGGWRRPALSVETQRAAQAVVARVHAGMSALGAKRRHWASERSPVPAPMSVCSASQGGGGGRHQNKWGAERQLDKSRLILVEAELRTSRAVKARHERLEHFKIVLSSEAAQTIKPVVHFTITHLMVNVNNAYRSVAVLITLSPHFASMEPSLRPLKAQLRALLSQVESLDLGSLEPDLGATLKAAASATRLHLNQGGSDSLHLSSPTPSLTVQPSNSDIQSPSDPGSGVQTGVFQEDGHIRVWPSKKLFYPSSNISEFSDVFPSPMPDPPAWQNCSHASLKTSNISFSGKIQSLELSTPSIAPPSNIESSIQSPGAARASSIAESASMISGSAPIPGRFQFIIGETQPAAERYLEINPPRMYGTPHKGVIWLAPPFKLFTWPRVCISTAGKPDEEQLAPAPPAPPPAFGQYAQAPTYVLNPPYRRGFFYKLSFMTSTRAELKQCMAHLQIPPNTGPSFFNVDAGAFVPEPIPNIVQLPLSIPFVQHVDDNPQSAVTVACVHSLETLQQYTEGT